MFQSVYIGHTMCGMDVREFTMASPLLVHSPIATTDLWALDVRGRTWSGHLRFLGESLGWEFSLQRNHALSYSHRFATHQAAMNEARAQRAIIEALSREQTREPVPAPSM